MVIARSVTVIARPEDVADAPSASVTLIVTAAVVSEALGVPVRLTELELLEFKVSQAGPETMDQVNGAIPPDSFTVASYAAPIVAAGRDVVVIAGPGSTVTVRVAELEG